MIKYVKDAFAYTDGTAIYLHEDLQKPEYQHLHDAVLHHELNHTDKTFTWKEFAMDLKCDMPKKELKEFTRTHQDIAFRMMLPINRFGINVNLFIIYGILIGLVYIILWEILWIMQLNLI